MNENSLFGLLPRVPIQPGSSPGSHCFQRSDEAIEWLQSKNWWGETNRQQQLTVPHTLITSIDSNWREDSQSLTVATKKEIFYRFLLPLIMHANAMILDRRERLRSIQSLLNSEQLPDPVELNWLLETADTLRISPIDDQTLDGQTLDDVSLDDLSLVAAEALFRLDVIPAGLALGQAAYESGYGSSRFAAQGNALFGQWTFGGDGLVPEKQRAEFGDHRIAAFEWPFDSVRSYFININSHPAYQDFRQLRADLRRQGLPLESEVLADGLILYSERGQEYVDILKSIIRVNDLAIADLAVFRDEPLSFILFAKDEADKILLRDEIEAMRASGELKEIVRQMALE